MSPIVMWTIVVQGVLPAAVLAAIAFRPSRHLAGWVVEVVACTLLIVAVRLAGLWLAIPWYAPFLFAGALAGVATRSFRRVERRWPSSRWEWSRLGISALAGLLALGVTVEAARGRVSPSDDTVLLTMPLRGGPFLVANGGSTTLVNPHLLTLGPGYEAYRGQSFAVDIVGIGRFGTRTRGIAPTDPADYAIFGAAVVAPCTGTVVRAFDEVPDMNVPERSRDPLEGNHVILDCDGVWVVLAHLRSGSLRVTEGDALQPGAPLGQVGNSGQSDEPHLHIHAQTPGTESEPMSGDPRLLRFGDNPPVRNQRLHG